MRRIAPILLVIAVAAGGFFSFKSLMSTPDVSNGALQAPDIQIEKMRLIHTAKDGSKVWEIWAEAASARQSETKASGVTIKFFRENQATLSVHAKELLLRGKGDMLITGEVTATGDDNLNFQGAELRWDEKQKLLWSDFSVKLERADMHLTGLGFEYWPEKGTLKIKKKAHLKIIKK